MSDLLRPGQSVTQGNSVWSADGIYQLDMQGDGNLCLYKHSSPRSPDREFVSNFVGNTHNQSIQRIQFNDNATVTYHDFNNAVIKTFGNTPSFKMSDQRMIVQNDGNVVIYATCTLWASADQPK